jgi:hypothetical protein
MGLEKDLPPGEHLVTLFRPFLEHLAASNLSPKTIQKHVDNMWVLGGEFIRDLHNDPPLRRRPVDQVLSKMIEYGGPLLYQLNNAQAHFHSGQVCNETDDHALLLLATSR